MGSTIKRNRTIALLRLAEALAEKTNRTEAEASESLVDALLTRLSLDGPLLYDAAGTRLAVEVPKDKAESRIRDLVDSQWWTEDDREKVRRDWDRWRIAERYGPIVLTSAGGKLGWRLSVRGLYSLSEMTEKARRGVSDSEDNKLTVGSPVTPDYLDPSHRRYSPKLAAAVHAWLAVQDEKGKTPRQALEAWLTKNAAELGLTRNGKPNKQGIEECAKVANWKQTGGAPKTPSRK